MACSVRPGRWCAIWHQRWPLSATRQPMSLSSSAVHPSLSTRLPCCGSERAGLPPLGLLVLPQAGTLVGLLSPVSSLLPSSTFTLLASLSLFQRLRTASSERPGSIAAIFLQRQPSSTTPIQIIRSSVADHSLRSSALRLRTGLVGPKSPSALAVSGSPVSTTLSLATLELPTSVMPCFSSFDSGSASVHLSGCLTSAGTPAALAEAASLLGALTSAGGGSGFTYSRKGVPSSSETTPEKAKLAPGSLVKA
mmetsp:Transcript_31497/g.67732  ORF Transcript_31497/g.67732 Transcript_31497/m.67732 type:complete len:251 (-) Transcript_31497:847-1599(-)